MAQRVSGRLLDYSAELNSERSAGLKGSLLLKPETHCTIFSCPRQKIGIVKQSWRIRSLRLMTTKCILYSTCFSKKNSVKIGHNILYNLKEFFHIMLYCRCFTSILNFSTFHCIVLGLTEMSVKLMDGIVCNNLPVPFLLFYGFIFYSVDYWNYFSKIVCDSMQSAV